MWLVEVEEDRSDLIDQMVGHETVHGKKKTQHPDAEVEAQYLVTCHTVSEKIRQMKIHDKKYRCVNLHRHRLHLVKAKGSR